MTPAPPEPRPSAWRALWRWLAQPHPSLPEADRFPAQMLAWLLLATIVLLLAANSAFGLTYPGENLLLEPSFPANLGSILLLILAYALNRAGRHRLAAGLTVGVMAAGVWVAVYLSLPANPNVSWVLPYLTVSVLLASLLLGPWVTALVVAGHLTTSLLVVHFAPGLDVPPFVNSLVFVGFVSGLLIAVSVLRQRSLAQIEKQNRLLADGEHRLRTILDHSPDAIFLIDPHHPQADWPIVDCNEAAAIMNGYSRLEMLGQSIDILNATSAAPGERAAYLDRIRREGTLHYETVHRRKDGTLFPVEVSTALITLSGRDFVLGIDRDITERKQADEALRRSEERFELVSFATSDAVWDWDLATGRVWWNQGVRKLFGYAEGEVGADVSWWEDRLHPNDRARVVSSRRAALDGGQEFWSREYRFRRGDGEYAHVFDRGYVTRDEQGQPLRLIGAMLDVTESKRVEDTLRESEARYRALFDASPVSLWEEDYSDVQRLLAALRDRGVQDVEAYLAAHPEFVAECSAAVRVTDVNATTLRLYGAASKAELLDNFHRVVRPDSNDSFQRALARIASGALDYEWEGANWNLAGEPLHVHLRWSVVPGYEGSLAKVLVSITDITERKRAEDTLRESEARYRALFDESPVSLWEEDYSAVKARLDALRAQGVVDFDAFLAGHPELIQECAELIRVTDVNKATLRLNRASRKSDLLGSLVQAVGPEMLDAFRDVLVNIAHRRLEFDWEGVNRTVTGERINISLRWAVVPGYEDTLAKVLVSIIDITERKRMEAALRESEALFRTSFEHSPVGIALVNPDGVYLRVNRSLCEMLGYAEADMLGRRSSDFTHPDDVAAGVAQGRRLAAGEIRVADVEKRLIHRTGRVIWVQRVMAALRPDGGEARYFVSMMHDITERRRVEQELTETNAQLSMWLGELEQHARETALLNDLVSLLQTCHSPEEAYVVVGKMAPALFPGDAGALFIMRSSRNLVETVAQWGGSEYYTVAVFEPDGCWALRRAQAHVVTDSRHGLPCSHLSQAPPAYMCVPLFAQGELLGCLSLGTPAGGLPDRKQQWAKTVADAIGLSLANLRLRESLRQQSIIDVLTGLFNRRYMEETLEREVRRCARAKTPLGIMMMDIDHFKKFNDTHGHPAGDVLLAELGAFLRSRIRADDIACRYGGEEFTLILPDSSLDVTTRRAESLLAGVRSLRVEYGGRVIGPVTMSLGVAAFPSHGGDGAVVLRAADKALYAAKRQGRDRVVVASS